MSDLSGPRLLTAEDQTSLFNCGQPVLNSYLVRHALDNQRAMLSRTYVVSKRVAVVGYYTLAIATVTHAEAPQKLIRGMPPYPIPAILMARFAVDLTERGRALGRSLFVDALRRSWAVMNDGPVTARLFVVDAKDEKAKAFYRHFDMVESPVDPMRLFLPYKFLRALFEQT